MWLLVALAVANHAIVHVHVVALLNVVGRQAEKLLARIKKSLCVSYLS
jgi:hypothetical protein